MIDAWVIAVAAALVALHAGVVLRLWREPGAFRWVPAVNAAVAGGVVLYWALYGFRLGHLAGSDALIPGAEAAVLLLSLLGLRGLFSARWPHLCVFAVHALASLAVLLFMLTFRMDRLF